MTAWALAHPWLVFWMFVLTLITVDSIASYFSPYCISSDEEEEQ